jgi:hypothetical protein
VIIVTSIVEPIDALQGGELDVIDIAPWTATMNTSALYSPLIDSAKALS